ncbi:MAG TPA: bifunctional precorrin-2 dehydrogenase/sirohydrochlorin ferrochelatase [Acidimicrobiales bacterium]|nr:bifunctional precorrin-2 dehydrogenase/sirohydrochlorin ferrochelatase [Acidimicrobiales bacterium]
MSDAPARTSPGYPVTLLVEGRACLVVGAGPIAARKAAGLLAAGAVVTVVAPVVSEAMEELAGEAAAPGAGDAPRSLRIQRRPYRAGEAADYRLVVTATGDPAVDGAVSADAESAGVWVNAADDPAHCSFYLPALARRGPVSVAVSTDGTSPALASWLRDRLDSELGPPGELEALAGLLAQARADIRGAGGRTEGLNWRGALDSDMLELIRSGQVDQARERLRACL